MKTNSAWSFILHQKIRWYGDDGFIFSVLVNRGVHPFDTGRMYYNITPSSQRRLYRLAMKCKLAYLPLLHGPRDKESLVNYDQYPSVDTVFKWKPS